MMVSALKGLTNPTKTKRVIVENQETSTAYIDVGSTLAYINHYQKLLYSLVQKLDYLTCSKFVITTSLYKLNKLVKMKFVFISPELHYMPDGLPFLLYNIFR